MVETAIALPLLLLILIISVDLLRLSYYSLTLQYVLNRAVREAVVGPVNRPPAYATQEEWIQGASVRLARSLGLSISDADIAICPYSAIVSGTPCDPLADDAGQPGELIVVQAVSPRSGFGWTTTNALSTRGYTLAAQVVGRNERWEQ